MCIGAPKVPKVPPAAERQPMQVPKEMAGSQGSAYKRRRRGMWASIMTSPQGIPTMPTVTGGGGSVTGG